jgi:hypothetical protein
MFRKFLKSQICWGTVFFVAMATCGASTSQAATILGEPVALSTLIVPDAMITVGDKKFTNFAYTFGGDMPSAAGVNVIPIQDDAGNYGLRFQGFFLDTATTVGGSDALITYDVEVTDPTRFISDAHIQGNFALPGPDRRGVVQITETFLPLGAAGEYTMTVYDDENVPTPKLVDWTYFTPPVKKLNVQKDIGILAVAGFPSPGFSFVDQTFSQIVPEPATLGLLVLGLSAFGMIWRRK